MKKWESSQLTSGHIWAEPVLFECYESHTLKTRKTPEKGTVVLSVKERRKQKRSRRLHYLDLTEEPRRNLEIQNFIQKKKQEVNGKIGPLISRPYACCVNFCSFAII